MSLIKITGKTIINGKTIFKGLSNNTPVLSLDSDASAYITLVEATDGTSLETSVKQAINSFVVGCKSDGIWNSLSTCCILAGARSLGGALIPLKGSAPTNVSFVSGDYSRLNLLGGTSKYLNSNTLDSSFNQNDFHMSVWQAQSIPSGSRTSIGVQQSSPYNTSSIIHSGSNTFARARNNTSTFTALSGAASVGLFGVSRNNSASYNEKRPDNNTTSISINSTSPLAIPYFVFSSNNNGIPLTSYHGKLSFYSLGQSINLEQLNNRVTTLMSDFASAISI